VSHSITVCVVSSPSEVGWDVRSQCQIGGYHKRRNEAWRVG